VVPAIRADRSRLGRVVAIAAVVVVLDQITKLIVLNRLTLGAPVVLVDGFFALTLVMNTGLAFGLLSGIPASWRWLVGVLSLVALVVLLRVALRRRVRSRLALARLQRRRLGDHGGRRGPGARRDDRAVALRRPLRP
jgi:signal peptidase II